MLQIKEFKDQLFLLACIVIVPSFIYSKALITGSIGLITLIALYQLVSKPKKESKSNSSLWFILLFFITFISCWNSEVDSFHWRYIILKLPFLILPLAFWILPSISEKRVVQLHLWLLAIIAIGATPHFFIIGCNYQDYIALIAKGQPIPTPVEHVKFSMFNAYAVVSGVTIFFFKKEAYPYSWKWPIVSAIGIVFIYMHVLSVRTGLIILYASLVALICYNWYQSRKIRHLLLPLGGLFGLIALAFTFSGSLRQKVYYMLYDWKMYMDGSGADYADSRRLLSAKEAIELWQENPLWGVGFHQIRSMCCLSEDGGMSILPHNQFLLFLVSTGVIGLTLFIVGFYMPLWKKNKGPRLLLAFLYLNYTISFIVENSFERSFSLSFFLFFALLLLNTSKQHNYERTTSYH